MFRPLSVLASRVPNLILWTVEPNSLTEPYLKREKREQMYWTFIKLRDTAFMSIMPLQNSRLRKKIE